jgi:mRNA interferase MazF
MRRGEIWLGKLNPSRGAEVGKTRPVLVLQADFLLAQGQPTVIVLPLTTQVRESAAPLRVTIAAREDLREACQVMPEYPRALDRSRLVRGPLTRVTAAEMAAVERSFLAVVGLDDRG